MADKYMQPVDNHFDYNAVTLEDVDDDLFLNSFRANSSISSPSSDYGAGAVGGAYGGGRSSSTNPFVEPQQTYAQRRRDIENRSLDSTQRSLGLLYETEEVGKATALELAKQREQLENSSKHLDEIHSTLRFSQRHLNSLKSVFGGLKNYLSGNRDAPPPPNMASLPRSPSSQESDDAPSPAPSSPPASYRSPAASAAMYDNHPVNRIRDDTTGYLPRAQAQYQQRNDPFELQLEANLEEMCNNLSRLKSLANDLGSEIESQNEFLDNMNYKIEDVDLKLRKQNKDIHKLLGKK